MRWNQTPEEATHSQMHEEACVAKGHFKLDLQIGKLSPPMKYLASWASENVGWACQSYSASGRRQLPETDARLTIFQPVTS